MAHIRLVTPALKQRSFSLVDMLPIKVSMSILYSIVIKTQVSKKIRIKP